MIGLGSHDLDAGISSARSRLYLANLLDNAERLQIQTFVVGPPPRQITPPAKLVCFRNLMLMSVPAETQFMLTHFLRW
ncbi:hypothetical protein RQN30_04795 [Arcanobacterium hippocoleae]